MQNIEQAFRELLASDRKFVETLLLIENKDRQRVPFIYNPIQADADSTSTGMDIWVKPSQVGFSSERIAKRLKDTLTVPGTNTVLIAYEDFITERLLNKVNSYYNHLASLNIPGFPEIRHNSTYEKTFAFKVDGQIVSTSSIYIASARSYVAGRAETIHHLLCDEFAFWAPGAMERILVPALARIPPGGTCDIFSTPNGMNNDFYDMYMKAKEGKSVFKPHFYSWWQLPEYKIELGDSRVKAHIPETNDTDFATTSDEDRLILNHKLTYSQIRWRRWMIMQMESLKRQGETRTLFGQEFPEDDVTCFLATGDMYFDQMSIDRIANNSYPAPKSKENLLIWEEPIPGERYSVSIDPGQARITQTAITVVRFRKDTQGNVTAVYCARDAGLYPPETTAIKAINISNYYNRAEIVWEANSHGLAITELLKHRRPIYFRKDIISDKITLTPGWLTTSKNKDYMMHMVARYIPDIECYDIEVAHQLRNHRLVGDKIEVIGASDILMALAVALVTYESHPVKRGLVGVSGWQRW